MTAREDEPESVVDDVGLVHLTGADHGHRFDQQRQRSVMGHAPPSHVDGAASGDGGQPGTGFRGDPPGGPGGQRPGVGILDAFLGQIDVACDPHRGGEHEGPLPPVRVSHRRLDRRVHETMGVVQLNVLIGRTSTPPAGMGTCFAKARASSRSAASTR